MEIPLPHPMISSGKEIKLLCTLLIDSEIKLAGCKFLFYAIYSFLFKIKRIPYYYMGYNILELWKLDIAAY